MLELLPPSGELLELLLLPATLLKAKFLISHWLFLAGVTAGEFFFRVTGSSVGRVAGSVRCAMLSDRIRSSGSP